MTSTVGQNRCEPNHHTRKETMGRNLGPLAALAVVALIGAGAGCSNASSNEAANSNDAANTTADNRDQAVRFAECMRENGVSDFPDPNASGEFVYGASVSPAVFKKAVDACKDLQPPGTLSAKRSPKQQEEGLTFAQCMRENGVKDFPDPVNGEPLVDTTRIPSSATNGGMTILNAAMQKCRDLLAKAAAGQ